MISKDEIILSGQQFKKMNELERVHLKSILGRDVQGAVWVGVYDEKDKPKVMVTFPFVGPNASPFPTLFWLIDPALRRAVAQLEQAGKIGEYETRLKHSVEWMARHREANRQYASMREVLIDELDEVRRQKVSMEAVKALKTLGIGGVANWSTIKCLHAQMAFHLVFPTIVGDFIVENLKNTIRV